MREGWEIKKLGEICEIIGGSTPKTNEKTFWDGDNFWITPAEMDGRKWISSSLRTITDAGVRKTNLKLLPKGTVLLSSRAPIGKIAITTTPMYCNQGFKNLVCSSAVSNEFVYWYLIHNVEYLKSLGTGATFKEISKKVVEQISIPVPPLPEQQKIVEELDCLSNMIELKKKQMETYDKLAQSIFYDMFGDPIANEKGWKTIKIKEAVKQMHIGPFGSALKTDCYVSKDNAFCMVYEQKHAIKKSLQQDNHYINRDKYYSLQRFEVRGGDIIMSCRGTIGEIFRLPIDAPVGIIHPSLMKIRLNEDIFSYIYFVRLLDKVVKREDTNGGCVQMAITAKALGEKDVPYPSMNIQQQFAKKIEAIEKQKDLIKQTLKSLEELFNSRMDYYFN